MSSLLDVVRRSPHAATTILPPPVAALLDSVTLPGVVPTGPPPLTGTGSGSGAPDAAVQAAGPIWADVAGQRDRVGCPGALDGNSVFPEHHAVAPSEALLEHRITGEAWTSQRHELLLCSGCTFVPIPVAATGPAAVHVSMTDTDVSK